MINDDFKNKTLEQKTQWLKEVLRENICEVSFTKVNGEIRVMPCTLKQDLLPPQPSTVEAKSRIKSPEVLSVWSTDKIGWRSFRIDSVTDIKVI